jgi:hypothetical protein
MGDPATLVTNTSVATIAVLRNVVDVFRAVSVFMIDSVRALPSRLVLVRQQGGKDMYWTKTRAGFCNN